MKIGCHKDFATLTVRKMAAEKKSYACVDTTFTMTYGKLLYAGLRERAEERS